MKIGVVSKNKTKINSVADLLKGYPLFNGSQAMKATNLTSHEKLGEHGGMIEILTKGRMNRTDFNRSAVAMALIHLENPKHF